MRWAFAVAAAGLLVAGCSSGSHPTATADPSPTPTATVGRPGGLIGVIDAARVASVCANARQAQILMAGGGSGAADALVAAAVVLERPPVDPSAAAAATTIRADVRRGHLDAAITAALAFCHSHGA